MLHNFLTTIYILLVLSFIVHKTAGTKKRLDDRQTLEHVERDENVAAGASEESKSIGSMEYSSLRFMYDEDQHCWITLNAASHYETMDKLDERYADARQSFEDGIAQNVGEFDRKLLEAMLSSRGRVSGQRGSINDIPAGLNLGGYCMMRMNRSVLFFHRMKLRNNTIFRINYLKTDLSEMTITAQLSLHDLHLMGSYERAITDRDPSILYYAPTFGLVEVLLKDVEYKMEGRMRMLEDSLFIVLVRSEISFGSALMMYKNNASQYAEPLSLTMKSLEEFIERMKSDLDEWLRDYFNEHLIFFTEVGAAANNRFREYEKTKTNTLNTYVEDALMFLKGKLYQINATSVKLPNFSIYSVTGMEIKLKNGVLRGLDSMYRRSIATGRKDNNIRMVDGIIGFSSLKVIYRYEAYLTTGVPPVSGMMILSADELAAHMALSLMKDPETVDLQIDFIRQLKPESLTIEGPANRMIANFKHILEYHIISIMSNTLIHNIRALRTLTKCQPMLFGHVDSDEPEIKTKRKLPYKGKKGGKGDGTGDGDRNTLSNKPGRSPDYVVHKEDSIELELPPNDQGEKKKVHLAVVESLNITNLNKK